MEVRAEIIWPVCAYLTGAIPFGLLIARFRGLDLLSQGSGNIGATNVTRVMGKRLGIITLLADVSKGLLLVAGCIWFLDGTQGTDLWVAATGLAAVSGHCYSVFLKFRGGKGVATAAGVFIPICPAAVCLAVIPFFLIVKKWGFVSAGSLAASAAVPLLLHFFCPSMELEIMAWLIAGIIWIKHRDNIGRLLRGEEKSWKKG
ncbi:MAG TPA: glycerol-3-phosphate 1-O-acyltransferase PlsY [Thermodesulfobacteriaceae bacterium]|nr:glycerol-3-phosphate 1-O-acyltransferase PlsY [Thermodesulfobacteriaceae bacterium]